MIYKPTYIKCFICNKFYKPDYYLIKDINDMTYGKLIKCINCKYYHLFSFPR